MEGLGHSKICLRRATNASARADEHHCYSLSERGIRRGTLRSFFEDSFQFLPADSLAKGMTVD
jgi:hypothetical protein